MSLQAVSTFPLGSTAAEVSEKPQELFNGEMKVGPGYQIPRETFKFNFHLNSFYQIGFCGERFFLPVRLSKIELFPFHPVTKTVPSGRRIDGPISTGSNKSVAGLPAVCHSKVLGL